MVVERIFGKLERVENPSTALGVPDIADSP